MCANVASQQETSGMLTGFSLNVCKAEYAEGDMHICVCYIDEDAQEGAKAVRIRHSPTDGQDMQSR